MQAPVVSSHHVERAQSSSDVQGARHIEPVHARLGHVTSGPTTQLPAPSQAPAGVTTPSVHEAALHVVPAAIGLYVVRDSRESHARHGLLGSRVPSAMHAPSIMQPVAIVVPHVPVAGSHAWSVQLRPSSGQETLVPAQTPEPLQRSIEVQRAPSSHAVPAGADVVVQRSPASSHASVVHARPSSHTRAPPPVHAPAPLQRSDVVQNAPSSQAVVAPGK